MSEPALEGELGPFLPTEILQLLKLAQATGRLELSRPEARAPAGVETAEVFFDSGRPVSARTSGPAVRTGEVLVHHGHVTRDAVAGALEVQRHAPGSRIGHLLRASGAASPAQVEQAVHEAQRRILYGVLLWREGRFRFLAGERAEDNDLPLDLDLDRLILEGLRLADQSRAGR